MNYTELGLRLRQLRQEAGLSRAELACRLGITAPALDHYERARRKIPLPTLEQWALACGRRLHVMLLDPGVDPAAALPPEDARLVELARRLGSEDRRLVEQLALGLGPGRSPELREAVARLVELLAASAGSAGSAGDRGRASG